ncbi:DUF6900 domain-containing protein [Schaalia sp. lx-100]|uniref:DUF6900 domain-containing protein n=1 Tax=Schaalia sp. lx-100 TaxID=2899081 RepID=UPI001E351003|nr:hypothetical protein [Schaalia sp. lx-100]MCD4556982.1 hypothetical protein [Schaalia sp. lx-100]
MARTTTARKSSKTAISETDLTALLTQIATAQLVGVDTLETQGSDSLDFVEVSVWSLKDALTAAFIAGQQAGSAGQTEIAWEGGEVEIIEFTSEGKHATGIRLPNDWEAKAWIRAHESQGCYAFRPTAR